MTTLRVLSESFIFVDHVTGSLIQEGEMIEMNDMELRQALFNIQKRFGTPTIFIATKCGVSREHFSRWLHNEHYLISDQLKTKIKQFVKGEM